VPGSTAAVPVGRDPHGGGAGAGFPPPPGLSLAGGRGARPAPTRPAAAQSREMKMLRTYQNISATEAKSATAAATCLSSG
jgi:hypothetical protein